MLPSATQFYELLERALVCLAHQCGLARGTEAGQRFSHYMWVGAWVRG